MSISSEDFVNELVEIRSLMSVISERSERVVFDVGHLRRVLVDGDGGPSMTVRVALAEQEIKRLSEERNDRKVPRAVWIGIVISTVVSVISIISSVSV
jgi:hypothetical protein